MKTNGIRIWDTNNGIVNVELPHIFENIHNKKQLHWSILWIYATGDLDKEFNDQVNKSESGYSLTWDQLNELIKKFYDVMEIVLIGCEDKTRIGRYRDKKKMYESCDIVIEMFDSTFWEVFSRNAALLDKLAITFKEVEFLESDFQSKQQNLITVPHPHQHRYGVDLPKNVRTRGVFEPVPDWDYSK